MASSPFSKATVGIDQMMHLPGTVVLPPVRSEAFISQRHEVNPALALNLLNDIQSKILRWQEQIRQLVQALHRLQAQGPMVEGWLESSADTKHTGQASEATLLRHGDTEALLQYIESLDDSSAPPSVTQHTAHHPPALHYTTAHSTTANSAASSAAQQGSRTEYRLCKLDANGQLRSQLCPPEQMGVVSIAIARYQKFKQLLEQKAVLDAKLQQAVDQLTKMRAGL